MMSSTTPSPGRRASTPKARVGKDQRFNRYYFPLEAEPASSWTSHLTFSKEGGGEGGAEASPLDAKGSAVKLPLFGHYDVLCPWDQDDEALNSSAYSPQLGYVRLQTARISTSRNCARGDKSRFGFNLQKNPDIPTTPTTAGEAVLGNYAAPLPTDESTVDSPLWRKYTSSKYKKLADIQELTAWVTKLRPRSVHDFKPILILLQGLIKDLLVGRMTFFAGEIVELQEQLRVMKADYEDALKQIALDMETHERDQSQIRSQHIHGIMERAVFKIKDLAQDHNLEESNRKVQEAMAVRAENEHGLAQRVAELEAEVKKQKDETKEREAQIAALEKQIMDMKKGEKKCADDKAKMKADYEALEAKYKALHADLQQAMSGRYCPADVEGADAKKALAGVVESYAKEVPQGEGARERFPAWVAVQGPLAAALGLGGLSPAEASDLLPTLPAPVLPQVLDRMDPFALGRVLSLRFQEGTLGQLAGALERMEDPALLAGAQGEMAADLDALPEALPFVTSEQSDWAAYWRDARAALKEVKGLEGLGEAAAALKQLHPDLAAYLLARAAPPVAARLLGLHLDLPTAAQVMVAMAKLMQRFVHAKKDAEAQAGWADLLSEADSLKDCQDSDALAAQSTSIGRQLWDRYRLVSSVCSRIADDDDGAEEEVSVAPEEAAPEGGDGAGEEDKAEADAEPPAEEAAVGPAPAAGAPVADGLALLGSGHDAAAHGDDDDDEGGLAKAQEQAIALGVPVRTRKVIVIPIMFKGGCTGVVSLEERGCGHCEEAARAATWGPLEHPVAAAAAQRIAEAAGVALGHVAEQERKVMDELEQRIEQGLGPPEGMAKKDIGKYKRLYQIITAKQIKLLTKTSFEKALGEIKRYNNPPVGVIKIMVAIFQLLNQPGLAAAIKWPAPDIGKDHQTLWKAVRKQIELSKLRPMYLVGRMKAAMMTGLASNMAAANKGRFKATGALMEPVTHAEAVKASKVVVVLRKWVHSMLGYHKVALIPEE